MNMSLTKQQKAKIMKHTGEMAFIGVIITILWALTAIAQSRGL